MKLIASYQLKGEKYNMRERTYSSMKASPEKEGVIRVTNKMRKNLSKLLGLPKGDIKYEEIGNKGVWEIKIKDSEINLRLHSTGALEVEVSNNKSGREYVLVKSTNQIINPYIEEKKRQDKYNLKINKKAFVPIAEIVSQVEFDKEERKEKKSFGQKTKEWLRIFEREMTEHQNLMAFVVGGAGVALTNAFVAGNPEAAVCLKNIISNAGRWSSAIVTATTAFHPLIYLAETKWGDVENRKSLKLMQGLRWINNLAFMASAGALVADLMIPDQKVETVTAPVQEHGSEKLAKGHHMIVYDSSNSNNGDLNSNAPSANMQPERHVDENTQVVGHTDVQVTQILDGVYEGQLGDADWVNNVDNNGQDLSNVLLDQTFEYLVQNGHDVHSIDFRDFFENRSDYLNADQIKYLDRIAETGDVSDYVSLLKSD